MKKVRTDFWRSIVWFFRDIYVFSFSKGSIYRRGARRWRKLYRVNGHIFQAKRFNRVSIISFKLLPPLLPRFFLFPSFFFFFSLSPLFSFFGSSSIIFFHIFAPITHVTSYHRSRHNNIILPVVDRFLIKGTCWLVNVNDHFVVIYSLNDNSPSIIRPLNA